MDIVLANIRKAIRDIPDFPKPGITFKDITPLLNDGPLFQKTIDLLADRYKFQNPDMVLGIESRGFIIGSALAYKMGAGFCIARKPGKLPYKTHSASYDLEYGSDTLEVHQDSVTPGSRIIIVDDLIATGGTASAAAKLVLTLGGEVIEFVFLIELSFLKGREKLKPHDIYSVIRYDSE